MDSSDRRLVTEMLVEIDARLLPHPLHRALGHVAHGGDLGERESTEEFQIDYLGERWLQIGKLVESIADLAQFAFVYAFSPTSVPRGM